MLVKQIFIWCNSIIRMWFLHFTDDRQARIEIEQGSHEGSEFFEDPTILLKLRLKDITDTCPSGVDHCICSNNIKEKTTGPFDPDEDLLGAIYTYAVCNPSMCFCKDDPNTPKDSRNGPMKAVFDTCPEGEMNRCLCHNNKKVTYPFDVRTLFFDCRPKRVGIKRNYSRKVHAYFEITWNYLFELHI